LGLSSVVSYLITNHSWLERLFQETAVPGLIGQNTFTLVNRVTRPRGGNQQSNMFAEAINQALWDINAQTLGLPLYQLLGGRCERVRAYASPLAFHLSDGDFCALLKRGQKMGFTAYKIKVVTLIWPGMWLACSWRGKPWAATPS
jgi:L-alanine-DL-glutamate epimerase-like enolase superfamily enzyme